MATARIEAYSDREILAIVARLADEEGWVTTREMAGQLFGVNGVSKHHNSCVAARLGRMRSKLGLLEKERTKDEFGWVTRWRLTDDGKLVNEARTRLPTANALNEMSETELLAILSLVGRRYQRASIVGAHLFRRELQHGMSPYRRS
jgi:hypothetical protein